MKVLVTGGTGFVGCHTVRALVDAGHQVRLFVRDPGRIEPALGPLGLGEFDVVTGDVTDPASARKALEGCDAALHCASVYTNDVRRAREVHDTNQQGGEAVLGQAVELGLDPIVHVSSIVALLPAPGRVIVEDGPVGEGGPPYPASKQAQERYARLLQEQGAPVVITYPGSVWGPNDPYDGESTRLARNFVRGLVPFVPTGGLGVVDVRDVALAHARLFEPGKGARRFMLGGNYTPLRDLVKTTQREAKVRRPRIPIPNTAAYLFGLAANAFQRVTPFRLPVDAGGPWTVRCDARPDNSRAERDLGVGFRSLEETVRDQVAWQKAAGRL